jgi:hypothetical protein
VEEEDLGEDFWDAMGREDDEERFLKVSGSRSKDFSRFLVRQRTKKTNTTDFTRYRNSITYFLRHARQTSTPTGKFQLMKQ